MTWHLEPLRQALGASRDMVISDQVCCSRLKMVLTFGDGCWLPQTIPILHVSPLHSSSNICCALRWGRSFPIWPPAGLRSSLWAMGSSPTRAKNAANCGECFADVRPSIASKIWRKILHILHSAGKNRILSPLETGSWCGWQLCQLLMSPSSVSVSLVWYCLCQLWLDMPFLSACSCTYGMNVCG